MCVIELTRPMCRLLRVAGRNGGNYHFKETELPAVYKLAHLGLLNFEKAKKGWLLVFTKEGHKAYVDKVYAAGLMRKE